jgi:hypothetical protein
MGFKEFINEVGKYNRSGVWMILERFGLLLNQLVFQYL